MPGIGPIRKKALISHFGTVEKIKNASKDELLKVNNLSKNIVNQIYDFFNS